ncbi:uncharacterized protein F5147DRAFT_792397 [Suillus discolor]|uniref:Uncharacterized protein n=1 Tax=Suillus discolor TaxID=1912936 RepID=A0A9P7JL33_9AGAM|nr:uncharacterized protein F5147DRAFT_792397 [Suillus discolor]KAG2085834.1 hypothetical protein F5147DRAFT_792397 [Suillus discolor]
MAPVKGYPVVVCCANLPVEIQNGEGLGGSRVVPEEAFEEGKLRYTTLKRVMWHESFLKLLVHLDQYSKTGYSYSCYDKIMHWLFPVILILSGDYEEQCMMSLICGLQCKCPCPVCLVPLDELHDLSNTFPIRSMKDAQVALDIYRWNRTEGEEVLKGLGLRPIANVLWLIENSDPHEALSLDNLHTLHGGTGGEHLLRELKTVLADLGCEAQDNFEQQVADFPRWHALTHFTTVIHITFSDGNKRRDLVKQAFYAALSVLNAKSVQKATTFFESFAVTCERTLAMIDTEFLIYDTALKDYIEYATMTSSIEGIKTDWNFPKTHLWKHAQHDINRKVWHSNGKDVAKQILRIDHHKCAALLLRGCLDTLDEQCRLQALGDAGLDDEDHNHINLDGHFKLSSPQSRADTIQDIENRLSAQDSVFQGFHKKLANFINMSLPTYGYQLTRWTIIPTDFQIHEYRYLKLNYESTVNWRQSTDHLQSNPSFHGSPRFDCALIQLTAERTVFVKIIFMFKCEVPDIGAFQFALVQPPSSEELFWPVIQSTKTSTGTVDEPFREFEDMVKIDFIGHQGPYPTYILPLSSKTTPPPTTNLFLPPPVTLVLAPTPSYGHRYPSPPKPTFPPPNSSYIREGGQCGSGNA